MAGLYESGLVLKMQEVGDAIFCAESLKTPFSRLMKRGSKPVQMLSEWPVQIYPDRGFAGTLDGTDLSTFNHTNREKMEAYAMWMLTEGWMVSKLARLTKTAGVSDELAKQAKDDGLILAQMIEKQLLSTDDTRAESGGDAYRSRGAFSWLNPSAQSVKPVPANFRPASGCVYTSALASFLPSSMITMLAAMATAKKEAVDLLAIVGLSLQGQMSTWAQRDPDAEADEASALVQYNLNAADKKLIQSVKTFEFDAGIVRTMTSFYLACTEASGAVSAYTPRSGLFVDLAMWELCFLQAPTFWQEPPKIGGPRGAHDACYLLKCLNPLGQGYVLTNS